MKQLSTVEIRDDLRELLSQTPLFAQCSDTLHDFIIDSADLRQYEANEVIVECDTQSESYSIIVRGAAKVKLSDGAVVGLMQRMALGKLVCCSMKIVLRR